jgi:hypothetical protein
VRATAPNFDFSAYAYSRRSLIVLLFWPLGRLPWP